MKAERAKEIIDNNVNVIKAREIGQNIIDSLSEKELELLKDRHYSTERGVFLAVVMSSYGMAVWEEVAVSLI